MTDLLLVEGPPGTGKTTYLSRRCRATVAERGPRSVAIASLTRTAAAEIAGRDTGVPEDLVGTLHAHAYRALERPDLAETPEKLREWNAEHPAFELGGGRRLDDAPDADAGQAPGDQLHSAVMNHRARMTPREAWTPEQREHDERWADFKRQTSSFDFTDLIERAAAEMPRHPALPEVLLLDEAQDFSALELHLAMTWARSTQKTVIVGDPRQALYGWRGSDAGALYALPGARHELLRQSHRVPRAVHAAAQAWAGQLTIGAAPYDPAPRDGAAEQLEISMRDPAALCERLEADLAEGADAMVLTSCSYMLAPLLGELRRRALPFHNPYRTEQGAWNPLRGARRLLAFLRPSEAVWGEQARNWTWDDLRAWTEPLKAQGVLQRGAKNLIAEKCRPDRFGESHGDRPAPAETLCELLGARDTASHPAFRLDVDWWQDHLLASKAAASRYAADVARRRGGHALLDAPRIVVGTVHSTKGSQARRVYLSPDLSKQGYWHGLHGGGEPREGVLRMGYVALTRAQERVSILRPSVPEHLGLTLDPTSSNERSSLAA